MSRKKSKPTPKRIRRTSDQRCLEDSEIRLEHALAEQLMHATALAQLEAEIPRLKAIIAALQPSAPQMEREVKGFGIVQAVEREARVASNIVVPDHLKKFIKPVEKPVQFVEDEDLLRSARLPGDEGQELLP